MIELYNRIHRTCSEFAAMADRVAALDVNGRSTIMAAFNGHWTKFSLVFGGVESFRHADRSRRTRFLLDLIGAEENEAKVGRTHGVSGAALLALFLRGVKYATRAEVDRMWQQIEALRDLTTSPRPAAAVLSRGREVGRPLNSHSGAERSQI